MTHHDEETGVLEVEVGINVNNRTIANFRSVIAFLHGELSQSGTIVGSIIFGEEEYVGSEVATQHFGYLETQE